MLKQRVITAIVLLAILLPALFYPSPVPFCAVALVLIGAAGGAARRLPGALVLLQFHHPPLVEQRHDGAVGHGLVDGIGMDDAAEARHVALLSGQQRRAGETDVAGAGEHLPQHLDPGTPVIGPGRVQQLGKHFYGFPCFNCPGPITDEVRQCA